MNMLEYIRWHQKMSELSNEDLARELLNCANPLGKLGELVDIAAERLSPGIIEKMAKEVEGQPAPTPAPIPYWLVFFEDAAVRPATFTDEAAARAYYTARLPNWNCHLFKQVDCNGKPV